MLVEKPFIYFRMDLMLAGVLGWLTCVRREVATSRRDSTPFAPPLYKNPSSSWVDLWLIKSVVSLSGNDSKAHHPHYIAFKQHRFSLVLTPTTWFLEEPWTKIGGRTALCRKMKVSPRPYPGLSDLSLSLTGKKKSCGDEQLSKRILFWSIKVGVGEDKRE